jgi:hypothetical protein
MQTSEGMTRRHGVAEEITENTHLQLLSRLHINSISPSRTACVGKNGLAPPGVDPFAGHYFPSPLPSPHPSLTGFEICGPVKA